MDRELIREQKLRDIRLKRAARRLGIDPFEQSQHLELDQKTDIVAKNRDHLVIKKAVPVNKVLEEKKASLSPGSLDSGLKSEIILRKLVSMGKDWCELEPYARQVFDQRRTVDVAGRMLELAYLHGALEDVLILMEEWKDSYPGAFFSVGTDIRPNLVKNLWLSGEEAILGYYIHRKPFNRLLTRIERFYKFWSQLSSTDPRPAWNFFRKYEAEIVSASRQYGPDLKLTRSRFLLVVGKLAKKLGYFEKARDYLEKIEKSEPEFQESISLLLEFDVETDEDGLCTLGRELFRRQDWRDRLGLLEAWIEAVVDSGGGKYRERNCLNRIFGETIKYFPENPECWFKLSQILSSHIDLKYLFPNIDRFYLKSLQQFRAPVLEKAIWEPVLSIESVKPQCASYWIGCASLHHFVAGFCMDEAKLWHARDFIDSSNDYATAGDLPDWPSMFATLTRWISRTNRFDEKSRRIIQTKVAVAGDRDSVKPEHIKSYLNDLPSPDSRVVERLSRLSVHTGMNDIERELILSAGRITHYTNNQLVKLWVLNRNRKQFDVCWRICSILKHRRILGEETEKLWAISGEQRVSRPLRRLPSGVLPHFFAGFSETMQRFLRSYFSIASQLPELLGYISPNVSTVKSYALSERQKSFLDALQGFDWIHKGSKTYTGHPEGLTVPLPPFMSSLPVSPWVDCLFVVGLKLGGPCWRWNLTQLNGDLDGLVPKLHKSGSKRLSGKVGRWLKQLTPSQRHDWYYLIKESGNLNPDEAVCSICKVLIRMAVAILPNHFEALDGLNKMYAPLEYIWDLEAWLVSDDYSALRSTIRTASLVEIPEGFPNFPQQKNSRFLTV
ncbi:MAG: hypothetical protein HRU19_09520 [Pseudobacteriovorax sp.]|nr:hypothetical protein [Pseudobacteriovorax sp.]